MLTIPQELADLNKIELSHYADFSNAAAMHKAISWSYFFPYLYFLGMSEPRQALLFEQIEGSILLYRLQERDEKLRLGLLLPPFPFARLPLRRALERMRDFNHNRVGRISRIQESDALPLAREGLEIRFHSDEYIYDCAAVLAMRGGSYKALRRKISHYANTASVVVRDFRKEDAQDCMKLRKKWYKGLLNAGVKVGPYYRYSQECLANAEVFSSDVLSGQVIEVDGTVRAFTFGGTINQRFGSIFITISDHDLPGLAYLQRYHLMKKHPHIAYFNDFSDSGRAGLAQMKRTFRPVQMHGLYSAREQ
jgi:hypothetical protein